MQIQPYLFLEGRCREAIDFYRQTLGAEVLMQMTFGQSPVPTSAQEGDADKIMHACVRVGETQIFMSDGRCGGSPSFQGFALSLVLKDDGEAQRIFAALGEGGAVSMPMQSTFFASSFGMTTDRFGVLWMVLVQK